MFHKLYHVFPLPFLKAQIPFPPPVSRSEYLFSLPAVWLRHNHAFGLFAQLVVVGKCYARGPHVMCHRDASISVSVALHSLIFKPFQGSKIVRKNHCLLFN